LLRLPHQQRLATKDGMAADRRELPNTVPSLALEVEDLEGVEAAELLSPPANTERRLTAEYAALLHAFEEASAHVRRFESAHADALSVPDDRRMQVLLAEASAGPMDKARCAIESERCANLRLLHLQSEYEAVSSVTSNLQRWLKAREEQPRDSGGGVETSYARGREQLAMSVMHGMDTGVEILNEFGSVFFTFTTLLSLGSDHALFLASVSCLALTVVARLLIALSNWPNVETGTVIRSTIETGYIPQKVRTGKDKRLAFLVAVPLYLIEPSSGRRFLKRTLRESVSQMGVDGTTQDMHPLAVENTILYVAAKTEIRTSLSIIMLADLPELTIEVVYLLFFSSSGLDFAFWFSIIGTLSHLLRQSVELHYDATHLPRVRSQAENVDITFKPNLTSSTAGGSGGGDGAKKGGGDEAQLRVEGDRGRNIIKWAERHGGVCRVLTLTNCTVVDDSVAAAIAEHCGALEKLSAADTRITDDGARQIASANPSLQKLFLNGTLVTDEGCAVVAENCRALQMFALSRTLFSDAGAEAVATYCRDLKVLGINTSAFTDAGCELVSSGCPLLHTFKLADTRVTDKGVGLIATRLKNLKTLHLFQCSVTDVGVASLATHCDKLQELHLAKTGLTDGGARALASGTAARSLRRLYLGHCTALSDEGALAVARAMPELTVIDVVGAGVSEEGRQQLRELLPECKLD
jgi:hypothetical protein